MEKHTGRTHNISNLQFQLEVSAKPCVSPSLLASNSNKCILKEAAPGARIRRISRRVLHGAACGSRSCRNLRASRLRSRRMCESFWLQTFKGRCSLGGSQPSHPVPELFRSFWCLVAVSEFNPLKVILPFNPRTVSHC